MRKKKNNTPRSRVKQVLRQLWLRSRERAAVLKRDGYTCQYPGCGLKQSRALGKEVYVQVHHVDGINAWEEIINLIFEKLLNAEQITLCEEHHKLIGEEMKEELPG